MKQACSLESMVDAVLSEMKRRGNAKNTIERHERAYSQFYEYALTQGENSYSKVLARSFLEEKEKLSAYRGPRFMEQYRIALNKLDDIAKGQDIRLRHLENGYHLKSSCFDWVIPFFEERLKRRLKNTYDVRTRLRILSLFLSFIETQNAKKLEDISINHIAAAFEASTDQNHFRSTIREFLSFAAENGWMPTNLSCFVPKIRRHRGVPTVYSTDDIETCLASIDRTTQSGKRTYAVLLICARLGLRNTDACELKFSDIDWVKKTISIVQMKTGIPLVLPLLPEIEDAINRYIAARPQSDLSFIFLRHKAPYYPLRNSTLDYELRKLLEENGINTDGKKKGAHTLRSSLASSLLKEGIHYPVIASIPPKKTPRHIFSYFSVEELRVLLQMPDPRKPLERRDIVLLSLLYDSGARAQELCGIRVGDIRFSNPASVLLHGKGGKSRVVPLMNRPTRILQQFIAERKFGTAEKDAPLFLNQRGEPITPACIRNVICKYISRAKNIRPDLFNESSYSPHSFRHSKAVHLLEAGTELVYIRDFLGHVSVQTTEIYATVSQSMLNSVLRNRSIPKVLNVDLNEISHDAIPDYLRKKK